MVRLNATGTARGTPDESYAPFQDRRNSLDWKKNHMLSANPEYQRGAVWKEPQKKCLLDSVLRGYPIPLIYLHHISTEVDGAKRDDFEVIDGQQRINAMFELQFLQTSLSVMIVETDVPNEPRDLFIRLQAGMPLNTQEKRDAWPGKFTEFVLNIAGKPDIAKYPGHPFFKIVMKATDLNRGEFRRLAARCTMRKSHQIKT